MFKEKTLTHAIKLSTHLNGIPEKITADERKIKQIMYNLLSNPNILPMTTRAITYLKNTDVLFEIIKYDHLEKGAEFAARVTEFPLERTIKTLVVEIGYKNHCLALLPGNRQLDLKKLARIFSVKRTAMVNERLAEQLTGYRVGGISPFGTKQQLPVVMEKSILKHPDILINAGQRGIMLKMTPQDIIKTISCRVAEIVR